MKIETPTTDAEADRLRQLRARFEAFADYIRNNTPSDVDLDIWVANAELCAEACEAMVEEMDDALGEFARPVPSA